MSNERDITAMIQSDDLTGQELILDQIRGTDRINQLFTYTILAHRNDGVVIVPDDLMLKPSSLVLQDATGLELHRIFGMFSQVRDLTEPRSQNPRVELTFVPRAFSTMMRETLDIFLDLSVPEIIEQCLQRCGLTADEHYDLAGLGSPYEAKEYTVQYKETDFQFISRLCEHHGIFFFVDHSSGKDVLVFGDENAVFPELERTPTIPFRPIQAAGGAFEDRVGTIDIITKALPKRYTVRDYNYRIPGVDLLASADVDPNGLGEIIEYGAHFKGPNEGQWFADIRAQELGATKMIWNGQATAPSMQAGQKFMLTEHPQGDTELLITAVYYHWPPEGDDSGAYGTSFEGLMAETAYRPPRRMAKPRVHGSLTGIIQAGADDGYAELDDQGRYKVKFYFDTAERGEAQASRFVRMMQPHAGGGYGMHFPLRPGIEVILTCIDGDPDRPIISGCVPNPETASPVSSANRDRNIIKTGGGNMIDISDEEGRQRFKFTTPTEGTVFQLGADNEAELGAVIKSSANVVSHAAGVVANGAETWSAIADLKGEVVGKNITSVAGVPNPVDGFDKIQKLVSSANKMIGSVNSLCDGIANFGKEMTDSSRAAGAKEKKTTEDVILKRTPEQKYPDDARTSTVGSPPVTVTETEAQFRARIVADRQTSAEATTLSQATTQSTGDVTMMGMYTLDQGAAAEAWKSSTANKILDGMGDVGGAVDAAMTAAKPLFSGTHKKVQKAIDSAAWASTVAQGADALATVVGSMPRKSGKVRTPGEKYHLSWATDSVVSTGLQGAYLMSPLNTHVHGGSRATISGKGTVGVYSVNQAEMSGKRVYLTSGLLFDVESKKLAKMKSGKTMSFTSLDKFKMIADKDMFQETKTKLHVKAADLYELDGGKEAKLKAEKWEIKSTKGKVDVEVKGDWSAAIEGGILWEHNKKARFYAKGDTVLLRHNSGGNFTAKNNHARMSMKSGASLKVESSKATLDGKSTLNLKASTIKAKGKCLLG